MGVPLTSATTPPKVMYCPEEAPIMGKLAGAALRGAVSIGAGAGGLTSSPGRGTGVGTGGLPTALSTLFETPFAGMAMAGAALSPAPTVPPLPLAVPPAPLIVPLWGLMNASGVSG